MLFIFLLRGLMKNKEVCFNNISNKKLRNKCAMTCVGNMNQNNFNDMVFSRFTSHFSLKKTAFTLAEGATHVAHWNNLG